MFKDNNFKLIDLMFSSERLIKILTPDQNWLILTVGHTAPSEVSVPSLGWLESVIRRRGTASLF